MRVKMIGKLTDDEGHEVCTPIELEVEVPEPEEVRGRERFLPGFHNFEQSMLGIQNEVGEKLREQYLKEVGRTDKKQKKGTSGDGRSPRCAGSSAQGAGTHTGIHGNSAASGM